METVLNAKELNGKRVVCWFSCGAASAVATHMMLAKSKEAGT